MSLTVPEFQAPRVVHVEVVFVDGLDYDVLLQCTVLLANTCHTRVLLYTIVL